MELNFLDKTASAAVRFFSYPAKSLPDIKIRRYVNDIISKKALYLESASALGTPQYFYDETSLEDSIKIFNSTFKKHLTRFQMFYAMKSNHLPEISQKAVRLGSGLDVSSGMELERALLTGCEKIIFSGPGKRDDELELAVKNSKKITIMLDSPGEYKRLSGIIKRLNLRNDAKISSGIRIRNPFQGNWNKFGTRLEELGQFLRMISQDDRIEAEGVQFHTSWNLGPENQVKLIKDIGNYLINRVPRNYIKGFRFFDIGGGYWPDSGEWLNPENTLIGRLIRTIFTGVKFDNRHYYMESKGLSHFSREISAAIRSHGGILKDLEIWAEPGRWISNGSMHILLKVIDVKTSDAAITDGGINILGWERPLTEYIPVINLSRPAEKENSITVFGSLCTPDDIWGRTLFGRTIIKDDIIIIPNQGAYTYSLRQAFIKPVPRIVRFDGNKLNIIKGDIDFSSF
jgi:diaminopimelate decarboxylase